MKILITTDWYTPVVNGVVTSVRNLRRELLLRGHDVRILTLSQSTRSFTEDGVTYIGSVGAGRIYPGARLKAALASSYLQEILEWGPDIIHSQCEFSTFLLAKKIAKRRNIPIIHTYHTVYEDYTHYFSPNQKWGRRMAASFSRWVLHQSACVIAPTEKVRAILEGYGIDREIRVIPTGLDLRSFTKVPAPEKLLSLRHSLGISERSFILLSVGRLAREKNLEEILTFFSKLPWESDLTLLLVGDGPYREALEQTAEELGIGRRVVFAGMVPPDSVADYYHLGDLFVSASGSETQGLTYLEALASGLPALCHRDDCLHQVIRNGQNGWQYETEEEFFDRLRLYTGSAALRKTLSQNAAEIAGREFSSAVFAENVEAAYKAVLNRATAAQAQPYREDLSCREA